MRFNPISPSTATGLFQALLTARGLQLQPALDQAVQIVGVLTIDQELHRLVPAGSVGSDTDIRLDELIPVQGNAAIRRPIVAMEIKGGRDTSNAHNRAGEAEKSHIKAAERGYHNRWTIMVMQGLDWDRIRAETPSSTELFAADEITRHSGNSWDHIKQRLGDILKVQIP